MSQASDGTSLPGPLQILVVEDQPTAAAVLRLLLESADHEVATAGDGESGLRSAREFRPDVIVLDIGLPGAMDGRELAEAIRSDPDLADVRLMALSGYGESVDQPGGEASVFDTYLVKPVSHEELTSALAELYGEES